MRFKIDENLPAEVSKLLLSTGYDACTVNDQNLNGAPDAVLIDRCRDEGRVLVTLDTDFSDIRTYPPEEYFGIIVIKTPSCKYSKAHLSHVQPRTTGAASLDCGRRPNPYSWGR